MPRRLLKYAVDDSYAEPRWFNTPAAPAARYDVVIIGAGGHGLATAYYLAKEHGV
ncbi:MAG: sarcosine oxidase subunit beta, partial [Gammaproteobacteria bacterium]